MKSRKTTRTSLPSRPQEEEESENQNGFATNMAAEEVQFEMGNESYFTNMILGIDKMPPPLSTTAIQPSQETVVHKPYTSSTSIWIGDQKFSLDECCKDFEQIDPYDENYFDQVYREIIYFQILNYGITDMNELKKLARIEMTKLRDLRYLSSEPIDYSTFTKDPDFVEIYSILDTEKLNYSLYKIFKDPDMDYHITLPNSNLCIGIRVNIRNAERVLIKRNLPYASLEIFEIKSLKGEKLQLFHLRQIHSNLKFIIQWGITNNVSVVMKNIHQSCLFRLFQRAGFKYNPLKNLMVVYVDGSRHTYSTFINTISK